MKLINWTPYIIYVPFHYISSTKVNPIQAEEKSTKNLRKKYTNKTNHFGETWIDRQKLESVKTCDGVNNLVFVYLLHYLGVFKKPSLTTKR